MPSPIVHLSAGVITYLVLKRRNLIKPSRAAWIGYTCVAGFMFAAMLPDIDSVVGIALGNLGTYHNQGTHSLTAALFIALFTWGIFSALRIKGARGIAAVVFLSYTIHLGLDWMTNGRGLKLLWPFSDTRYLSPFPVFYGVKWSDGLFNMRHFLTIGTEVLLIVLLTGGYWLFSRRCRSSVKSNEPV